MASKPEINFYGNVAELIRQAAKLVTLRSAAKDLGKNTPAVARVYPQPQRPNESEQLPIRVISEESWPLEMIHPAILLLDGFLSAQQAATTLEQYYPDRKWTPQTVATSILFITEEARYFIGNLSLHLMTQLGQQEIIHQKAWRNTIFDAFYYWLVIHHQVGEDQYLKELLDRGIITDYQAGQGQDNYQRYLRTKSGTTDARVFHSRFRRVK